MQFDLSFDFAADVIAETRRTGILPEEGQTAGFTDAEKAELGQAWLAGMAASAETLWKHEREKFAARGGPFRWLLEQPDTRKFMALEEAVDVVDRLYPAILAHGLDHDEDMGLLLSGARQQSEGVRVKRDPYGQLILVSVVCTTGPTNFDPVSGTVEFEPGSKSHLYHLVYDRLPSLATLAGDIAAHPVVTSPENRSTARCSKWQGEGWTGPDMTRPVRHRSWQDLPWAGAVGGSLLPPSP